MFVITRDMDKMVNHVFMSEHVFLCSNLYIYTTLVQEVCKRDRSPEVDDVEGLAVAATKHLEVVKQRDEAESSFIIEKIEGKPSSLSPCYIIQI